MVTIIVLVYNNLIKLERTIISILQQDYSSMEVIVSDDCSIDFDVDKVYETIKSYKEYKDNQINLIVRRNNTNQGIVKHYNNVIKISSGEIIIPLSSGDTFNCNNTVSTIWDFFNQNHCMVVTAKRECIHRIYPSKKQIRIVKKGGKKLINSLCHGNYISGSCLYYRRSFFDKYGYFDERLLLVDDYPMLLRMLFAHEEIAFLDVVTIHHDGSGVSNHINPNPLFQKDMQQIYNLIIKPHKSDIGVETFRYLECRNYVNTHTGWKRFLYCLRYPDVILIKMVRLLVSKVNCE